MSDQFSDGTGGDDTGQPTSVWTSAGTGGYSPDQFTTVTTESYGQQLGGSLVALLFGLVLLPAAIFLLYWNEGRAVTAERALSQAASSIVEGNASAPDPRAEGRLVHVTGTPQPAMPARDPLFGVSAPNLLRLQRTVEMYQWQQQQSSHSTQALGGTKTTETTYTYQRIWSSHAVNSSTFRQKQGHENPPMPVASATFNGTQVTLGAYRVSPSLLARMSNFTPLTPEDEAPPPYRLVDDTFYRGADPQLPDIGDVRVRFTAIPAQTFSVAAAQSGGGLTAFYGSNGYTVAIAEPGEVSAAVLLHDARKKADLITWGLRGGGFVSVLIALVCVSSPLTTLFAVVPLLKSVVGAGAFLAAFTLAVPITLVTIGIAWIVQRPLTGAGLLGGALLTLLLLRPRRRVR
jgi:hypothetical protein